MSIEDLYQEEGLREGPRLEIERSCQGCRWVLASYYAVQGDSGYDVSCGHPSKEKDAYIGDSTWHTPDWCSVLKQADPPFGTSDGETRELARLRAEKEKP